MNTSQLLTLLSSHIGANNGMTAAQISSQLNISMRRVRHLVCELREEGTAVCGTPEELEETCQFLRGRAMHSLMLESRLRKMALEDLIGQMRLRT